jgi:anti-anti-sigma regulatory factor/nitrogen fixation/metabolism regulation signal transduction histidine kinase
MLRLRTRFVLSGVLAALVVFCLIALVVGERQNYTAVIEQLDTNHSAALQARALTTSARASSYNALAYMLGRVALRDKFTAEVSSFQQNLDALQQASDAGRLDSGSKDRLAALRQLHATYTAAAEKLFAAADAQRNGPSPANQAWQLVAWQTVDGLGAQLEASTTEVADRFVQDAEQRQAEAETRGQQALWLLGGLGTLIALLLLVVQLLSARAVARPMAALLAGVEQLTRGEYGTRVDVRSGDEVGILGRAVNTMADTIEEQTRRLSEQFAVAEAARVEAEHAREHISEQLTTIEQQADVIREMSVPVLPVSDETLVMPLIGALDTNRLRDVQDQALLAIERNHTRHFLLDLTGVPLVDSQVAQGLLMVVQTARLLGADVTLIGIRPEVAQSMVALGLDRNTFRTARDLQTAFRA